MRDAALLTAVLAAMAVTPVRAQNAWVLWRSSQNVAGSSDAAEWIIEDAFEDRVSCMTEAVKYRDDAIATSRASGADQVWPAQLGIGASALYKSKDLPGCPCLIVMKWRCMPDSLDMRQRSSA